MSTLVVVGYNDIYKAAEVRIKLWKLQLEELSGTGGTILKTSLSNEGEARLQAALDGKLD